MLAAGPRRRIAVEEFLQRIDRVVRLGEFQARLLRDRPDGAEALGEFGELGIDRIVLPGRRDLLARFACPDAFDSAAIVWAKPASAENASSSR